MGTIARSSKSHMGCLLLFVVVITKTDTSGLGLSDASVTKTVTPSVSQTTSHGCNPPIIKYLAINKIIFSIKM